MKREFGLLKGQGFGKASRKAHPTMMGGVDKVQLPNKPGTPYMPPAQREAMQKNYRQRSARRKTTSSFNSLSDKGGDNPIWGD